MYLFQASKYTYEPLKYTYDKLYLWGHILPHHPCIVLLIHVICHKTFRFSEEFLSNFSWCHKCLLFIFSKVSPRYSVPHFTFSGSVTSVLFPSDCLWAVSLSLSPTVLSTHFQYIQCSHSLFRSLWLPPTLPPPATQPTWRTKKQNARHRHSLSSSTKWTFWKKHLMNQKLLENMTK